MAMICYFSYEIFHHLLAECVVWVPGKKGEAVSISPKMDEILLLSHHTRLSDTRCDIAWHHIFIHHNLLRTFFLGSKGETVLIKQPCYISKKSVWIMVIFLYNLFIFGTQL